MAEDRFKIREVPVHELYDSEHPEQVVHYRGDLETAREVKRDMETTVAQQKEAAERIQAEAVAAHRRELLLEDQAVGNDR